MLNLDVRDAAKRAGVKLWQIADALGYSADYVLSRKLRKELPQEEKARILSIIYEISNKEDG